MELHSYSLYSFSTRNLESTLFIRARLLSREFCQANSVTKQIVLLSSIKQTASQNAYISYGSFAGNQRNRLSNLFSSGKQFFLLNSSMKLDIISLKKNHHLNTLSISFTLKIYQLVILYLPVLFLHTSIGFNIHSCYTSSLWPIPSCPNIVLYM